mgnify:CR=1 FL=1
MNVKSALTFLMMFAAPAWSQGFAGLGEDAEGFAIPQPEPSFSFPQDHGAHPDYRIEWWYLTANLTGDDGAEYGVQWTLFRSALRPDTAPAVWDGAQIFMGHAGLTTADTHFSAERFGRGSTGQAGVSAQPFAAWIDDWQMTSTATGAQDALSALDLRARGDAFSYDLALSATGPLVFHGQAGYSVKSADGQASYYYSQPFYEVEGVLSLPQGGVSVSGSAWLDREWSSQPLSPDQTGWDWVSLQFDSGDRLMGFALRSETGPVFTSATWIDPEGISTSYPDGALTLSPLETSQVAGREVPTRWRIELPARGLIIETTALNPNSWMETSFEYWEGPIRATGSHTGRGYLEMTGYD